MSNQPMSREQVEELIGRNPELGALGTRILATDAALRAQLDTSMRRQETLAKNVNDGLLEIKALRAENERLTKANEAWHTRMSFVKTDTEALQAQVTALTEQLRLCNIDQCNAEAQMTKLTEEIGDAHGACCEAGIEEQYESSGDLVYYTVAARIRLLAAQMTALERDFGIQREYWNECEHKLAAMTQERDDNLRIIAEANAQYWEDHKYTDIKKIDELSWQLHELVMAFLIVDKEREQYLAAASRFEEQLAVSEQRVKELEKVFEYRRSP